jgi:hypothetical protein
VLVLIKNEREKKKREEIILPYRSERRVDIEIFHLYQNFSLTSLLITQQDVRIHTVVYSKVCLEMQQTSPMHIAVNYFTSILLLCRLKWTEIFISLAQS